MTRMSRLLDQPERGDIPSLRVPMIMVSICLLALTATVFFRVGHLAGLLLLIGEIVVVSWAWIAGGRR
ncbi:hypothetical protein ACFOW9_16565 [Arthrobacter cryoconiti]|uniref:Uncharacterized protein n=1 Tax=Arthrobacter cryoconiti TaxID=748907 RepID=A0ABV8R4Q7_9MICC|nr:hypothetical protein [Arthrobacter cryoconiti]